VHEYPASDVAAWSGALTDPAPALSIPTPNGPLNIAFDGSGNLWVAGFDVPVTYEISAAAIHAGGSVVPTDSLASAYLVHGSGLAFDRSGNLWEGTEAGYLVGYSSAQLAAASHGEPNFAQVSPTAQFDQLAFDNAGNLWAATETPDVLMFSPSQLSSGDVTAGARTLTSAAGDESFGIAFNTHASELPIASTLTTSSHASRAPHSLAVHRAPPPLVRLHDGSSPGRVRR
jgi:ligand-binding sensor domain-containing protein